MRFRRRTLRRLFPLSLLLLLFADPALSQNLLVNPGFDRDLSGWSVATDVYPTGRADVYASAAWSAPDALGSASSGSAELQMNATLQSNASASLSQCVAVRPSTRYAGYARARVASQLNATVWVLIDFFDGPLCAGGVLHDPNSTSDWALPPHTFEANDSGGAWLPGAANATTPVGAVSARLSLSVAGSGTFYASRASFAGNVDEAFFGVAPVVTRVVPIVLDVTTATARYTTELTLTNDTPGSVPVSALYTPSLGSRSGGGSVSVMLGSGEQRRIPDVLGWLRADGLPLPPAEIEAAQGGTLKLDFTGPAVDAARVWALARTGSDTHAPLPEGRAGTAYVAPLVSEGSGSRFVEILVSNEHDRSNLGIVNFSDQPVTFDVKVADFSGRIYCCESPVFTIRQGARLPPWGWMQIDSPELLEANQVRAGFAAVTVTSGPPTLWAYGVINDRATNDGSFLTPIPSVLSNPVGFVPAVEGPGFVTELTARGGGSPIHGSAVLLAYAEALSPALGAGGYWSIGAQPFSYAILDDLIEAFRHSTSMAIGPAGAAGYGGALTMTPMYGAWGQVRILTRGPAGRFGVYTPFLQQTDAATERAAVYGLLADGTNRSNVAVMNVGDVGIGRLENGPVTLRLQVHDGNAGGAAKGAPIDVTLGYSGWKQFNDVLRPAGVTEGWVEITRLSGTAVWLAYGVVNDGAYPGQRTDDGAFVPMSK